MTTDDIRAIAFTVREINSVSASLEQFSFILTVDYAEDECNIVRKFKDSLECCFDSVEIAYAVITCKAEDVPSKSHTYTHNEIRMYMYCDTYSIAGTYIHMQVYQGPYNIDPPVKGVETDCLH